MSKSSVTAFAPATVANLACGFDVLGMATDGLGDKVNVALRADEEVVIESIENDGGRLPLVASANTAGVSILALRAKLGSQRGFSVKIKKGLPLGSGLGSSAASSVAAVVAANELLGSPLRRDDLLPFAMEGERVACGAAHADNVAPALMGGIVLIRSYDPLDAIRIDYPPKLHCVLVSPAMELKTSDARMVLRKQVRLGDAIKQWGNLAALVAGLLTKDFGLIGRALRDDLIEPERAVLIPGFYKVKEAAVAAGALGCSISGSGPTIFALVTSRESGEQVGRAMQDAFSKVGLSSKLHISNVNAAGATISEVF